MKKTLFVAAALLTLSACTKAVDTGDSADAVSADDIAAELWTAMDGYESWDNAAGWDGIQPSSDVHGDFVQIWVNSVEAGGGGEGAIIVKRGYDDAEGTSPKGEVSVMYKTADHDGASGWFWAKFDDAGTPSAHGETDGCIGCHSGYTDHQSYKEVTP